MAENRSGDARIELNSPSERSEFIPIAKYFTAFVQNPFCFCAVERQCVPPMPVRGVCPRGSHVRPETVPVLSGIDGRMAGLFGIATEAP